MWDGDHQIADETQQAASLRKTPDDAMIRSSDDPIWRCGESFYTTPHLTFSRYND